LDHVRRFVVVGPRGLQARGSLEYIRKPWKPTGETPVPHETPMPHETPVPRRFWN